MRLEPCPAGRDPVGQNQEDYSVIENGVIVGRIFFLDAVGPQDRPWMWASGHNGDIKRAAHGRRARRRWRRSQRAKLRGRIERL